MKPRIEYPKAAPGVLKTMLGVEEYLHGCDEARQHFSEQELVNLSLAVIAINGWNRLAIAFRSPVGQYQPGQYRRKPR